MSFSYFLQTLVTGLSSGMVAYLMVAGMSLIISGMNMINFGQGAFFVLGTYLTYSLSPIIGFFPTLLIVPILVGVSGYFVELPLRPLFGKNMLYIMLLTFGVAYIVVDLMIMVWGYQIRLMQLPKMLTGAVNFFGIYFPIYYLFMILVGALIATGFWFMMNKTKLGMIMRAIINDREMVSCLGIDTNKLFSIMFMIGIGIAGIGGVLNAPVTGMSPKEGLSIFSNIMPILIIGGLRNMNGCLPAALLIGLVNAFGAIYLPQFYNLLAPALMVISVIIKPNGLFTKKGA